MVPNNNTSANPETVPTGAAGTDQAAELARALAELKERNERFLSILNAHPETIYVVDPDTYEVLFVNKTFRDMLGQDPVGRKCFEAFQGAHAPCDFCTNEKIRQHPGQPHRWEFHNQVLDRHFDITDLLIPWSDGRLVRYELAVDITAHKKTRHELETVIATSVDGYWVCDGKGGFLKVNDALCRMLGYTRPELLNLQILDIEPGLTPDLVHRRLDRIARLGSDRFETRHRRRDGSPVDVEISATYLPADGGRFHVFVRDISQSRRHVQERERLIEALGRSNAELEQFAYFASHDLQEPLRKIQAFGSRLASLLDDRLDEKSRDYLTRILNSSERMQNLINALLSYARLSTRARPPERVDLAHTARQVMADLEMRIEQTGGQVEIGPLPVVEAEPVQMHLLLLNLLGNGLKFGREGVPPVVTVSGETGDGRAVLRVRDNGIGFDEKYNDRIFKIFQRLHGPLAYEGTGIGLAVCQKIVERHRGSISAASRPGEGAEFTVILPLTQPRQEEPAP